MVELAEIGIILQTIGVLSTATAAVIGVRSYVNSNKRAEDAKKKEQETRDRELETRGAQLFMGFYDKFTSKESNDTLYLIQSWKVDSVEEFMNMWNDQKRRGIWSSYWMLYESIGVLVHEDLVDIRIVARYISYFRFEWEKWGPFIKQARVIRGRPRMHVEAEYLYDKLMEFGKTHPDYGIM